RPGADNPAINALALQCVSHFDHFRAPPSEQEIQRRRQHPLSERQLGLLQKWGYPYTDEEFRFHLTLSDAIDDHRIADAFYRAAVQYFDIPEVMRISEIALFFEATAGADFRLLRRYPLTGKKPFE
ncbi:MAG: DUF1045 domain-containing protein, partial [Burkholderiales bacterium]|nr:DUF1045 domain-containing protein [Burkholderiales bacterium]